MSWISKIFVVHGLWPINLCVWPHICYCNFINQGHDITTKQKNIVLLLFSLSCPEQDPRTKWLCYSMWLCAANLEIQLHFLVLSCFLFSWLIAFHHSSVLWYSRYWFSLTVDLCLSTVQWKNDEAYFTVL